MKRTAAKSAENASTWWSSPGVRGVVSLLLALHVAAVFIAPFTAPPAPPSALSTALYDVAEPYLDLAYLNHGYGFFSPNPGANFIIHYRIERNDGRVLEGVLPDLNEHWPRLRYHRHFMLTSQALMLAELPAAYARHLKDVHDARSVRLEYVEHRQPTPEQVLAGMKLDDPRTYQIIGLAAINEQDQLDVRRYDPPLALAPQRATTPAPYAAPSTYAAPPAYGAPPTYGAPPRAEYIPAQPSPLYRTGEVR